MIIKKTKELGITLIQIPYWWNQKISSLRATIASIRPDVMVTQLNSKDVAIPTEPKIKVVKDPIKKMKKKELSSQLMLATNWNKDDDPTGW